MEKKKKQTANTTQKGRSEWLALCMTMSAFGFTLFGSIGIGIALGCVIECYFHISPWGSISGGLFGSFFGFYSLYRQAIREIERDAKEKKGET